MRYALSLMKNGRTSWQAAGIVLPVLAGAAAGMLTGLWLNQNIRAAIFGAVAGAGAVILVSINRPVREKTLAEEKKTMVQEQDIFTPEQAREWVNDLLKRLQK